MAAHKPSDPRFPPESSDDEHMMQVSYLYDLPLPTPFAAPIQILSTCRALAAAGVRTTVFAGQLHGDAASCLAYYGLEPHHNLEIRPLFSRLSWRLQLPWRLVSVLGHREDSGAHMILSRGETGVSTSHLFTRAKPAKVRFVYEAHRLCFAHLAERLSGKRWDEDAALPERAIRLRERERGTVEGADAIICLTEGVRQALARSFRLTQPTLVLPSGTSMPADNPLEPMNSVRERDIDVLYVGKLGVRKGLRSLVAAMRQLPARRLCIVGGTPDQVAACRKLTVESGVSDRIDFVGFIEPWRLPDYYDRARIGVCPLPTGTSVTSERFTSPLKLLEMMAHGIPVVASDLPSTRAMVTHGHSALLVPADDPAALAGAIRMLLEDASLARRLATAARQRAAEFSWQERARRLLEFLELVARLPGRSVPAVLEGKNNEGSATT